MKCKKCGLPLSPTRTPTNCPRCGAYTGKSPIIAQPQYQRAYWEASNLVEADGTYPSHNQWAQNMQAHPVNTLPPQIDYKRSGQVYLPGYSPSPPPQFIPPSNARKTKLGFIVAGICILTGCLILTFVYFSATGLPDGNSSNATTTTGTSTSNMPTSTPATTLTATTVPSQTATTYPGQHYIDNVQMSTSVDPTTLQPSQPTTTFKVGQNIYVSFQVHPNGRTGAVCLAWYLNSKPVTNFSLPISATSRYSYAYAIFGGTGPSYVELYWASSTKCTDQILAQHIDFTVTS